MMVKHPKLGLWIRPRDQAIHSAIHLPVNCTKRDCCEKSLSYTRKGMLGRGQVGSVYKCKHIVAGGKAKQVCSKFALKVQSTKQEWENEIWALKLLNKKRFAPVPTLVDYWMCQKEYFIVMDLILGERLYDLANKNQLITKKTQIIDLVENLKEMNRLGVYHNDVHDKNFFWDSQKQQFVIIDFGWATSTPNNGPDWPDWKLVFAKDFALDDNRLSNIKAMYGPFEKSEYAEEKAKSKTHKNPPKTHKSDQSNKTVSQTKKRSQSDIRLFEKFLQAEQKRTHKKPTTLNLSFNII